jgi:hypothetical protein
MLEGVEMASASAQRLLAAREGILFYTTELILEKWEDAFDVWLDLEAPDDMARGYKMSFKDPYQEYMNPVLKNLIVTCSAHSVIAIRSFMKVSGKPRLDEVIEFAKEFIRQQLSEFESMCIETGIEVGDEL